MTPSDQAERMEGHGNSEGADCASLATHGYCSEPGGWSISYGSCIAHTYHMRAPVRVSDFRLRTAAASIATAKVPGGIVTWSPGCGYSSKPYSQPSTGS